MGLGNGGQSQKTVWPMRQGAELQTLLALPRVDSLRG